jgi:hypothetical protein
MELSDSVLRAMGNAGLIAGLFFIRALWLYFKKPDDSESVIDAECIEETKPQIKAD